MMPHKFFPRFSANFATRLYIITCKTCTWSDDGMIWRTNYEFYKEKYVLVHMYTPTIKILPREFSICPRSYGPVWTWYRYLSPYVESYVVCKPHKLICPQKGYDARKYHCRMNWNISKWPYAARGLYPLLIRTGTCWRCKVMIKIVAWRSLCRRPYMSSLSLTVLDSWRIPLLAKSNTRITRAPHFETIWWTHPSQKFSVDAYVGLCCVQSVLSEQNIKVILSWVKFFISYYSTYVPFM